MASEMIYPVFVETSLGTNMIVLLHNDETGESFKEKLCKEHTLCFPEFENITVSTLKVKKREKFFCLPSSMVLRYAFDGNTSRFMWVDAVKSVDNVKLLGMVKDEVVENTKIEDVQVAEMKPVKDEVVENTKIEHVQVAEMKPKKKRKKSSRAQPTCATVQGLEKIGGDVKNEDVEMVGQSMEEKQPVDAVGSSA